MTLKKEFQKAVKEYLDCLLERYGVTKEIKPPPKKPKKKASRKKR